MINMVWVLIENLDDMQEICIMWILMKCLIMKIKFYNKKMTKIKNELINIKERFGNLEIMSIYFQNINANI